MPRSNRHRNGPVRDHRDWQQRSDSAKDAHDRALKAIGYMRSSGLTLTEAAKLAGTTPATVRRYAGSALTQTGNRYRASSGDRLYRRMAAFGYQGRTEVDVRSSRAGSLIGAHFNAVSRYLATGDAGVLAPFRGRSVGGVELLTDPARIEQLAARRELDIDDIYPRT